MINVSFGKNLKKATIGLMVCIVTIVCATSCGGNHSSSSDVDNRKVEQKKEIQDMLVTLSDNYSTKQATDLLNACESLGNDSLLQVASSKLLANYESKVKVNDSLMAGSCIFPVYAQREDSLRIIVETERNTSAYLFNAKSHQLLKSLDIDGQTEVVLPILHDAVYLLEVDAGKQQYGSVDLSVKHHDIIGIKNPMVVKTKAVNCEPHDFLATKIKGVKMINAFNEVRKFTLRGNLKALFSGSSRALVPIQVEDGATDILYSLTISTNENAGSDDKDEFYDEMTESYSKVKLFGLPVYEKRGSTTLGLLSTMLGMNEPVRDEDAYINMYVFFNASQARKFQNGASASGLKYSLDYSTLGTQSCNGRIPCQGRRTVYLAFQNERMRYNNYVWLSALLVVPHTEYVRQEYFAVPLNKDE